MATLKKRGVFALIVATCSIGAAFACSSSSSDTLPGLGDAGQDGALDGSNAVTDPELMFRGFQDQLVMTCGGVNGQCHTKGTFMSAPPWLAPPDPYVSAKAFPGIIPASNDPQDSVLLTQVEHEGPALISTPTLFDQVRDWVVAEVNANGAALPATAPIAIVPGANTVDLSALAGGLAGATLTFTASSSSTGFLTILNMKISAPVPKGLHIESPFFVIIPSKGPTITDTTDGFQGTLDVAPGQTVDFFGGSSVLQKWDPAGKLKIVFTMFSAVTPADAGAGGCKAVATFTTSAAPAFMLDLSPDAGPLSGKSCFNCHGGGNGAAQFAMDLSKLGTDNAAACAQVLNRIAPGDPTNSQILLTPTGNAMGDINHADAGGPASTCAANPASPCLPAEFITDLTTWINAEK